MSSSEIVVILNPRAGRYRARRQEPVLRSLFEQACRAIGLRWHIVHTQHPGHAALLARQAAEAGASIVVAAGGDGTVGEVANGIVGTSARLGIIPLGTGNDFARNAGISEDITLAIQTLLIGKPRRVDLGYVNGRYFVNVAGCGFDAAVARRVNQGFRFLSGTAAYVAAVLQTIVTFKPTTMRIVADENTYTLQALLCSVANTPSYGGGMRIAPYARIDDGLLDVCVVRAVPKIEFVRVFPQVFSGKHITHPNFLMLTAQRVYVESDPPVPVLIDGDVAGTTPADFQIYPAAIEAVLPAK